VTEAGMREWLAQTLAECCDGQVSAAEILETDSTLAAIGVGSLALVRLVDAVESKLDIIVELDDTWFRDLDSMTAYLSGLTSGAGR